MLLRCTCEDDVKRLSGSRVVVVGTYTEVDLRKRPSTTPEYIGRVAIVLADDTHLLIEPSWSSQGDRSAEERSRLAGHTVEVTAVVYAHSPAPPEQAAYIIGPCICDVEEIRDLGRRWA